MKPVLVAFLRGLAGLLHPAMLLLLLLPFAVALAFWSLVAWFVWDPVVDFLRQAFFEGDGPLAHLSGWVMRLGFLGLKGMLAAAVATLLLAPLMFVSALVLIAVVAMPAVNRHLGRSTYADVARRGAWRVTASLGNALFATAVFCAGWLLTMPLWLLPPLGFIVPWLWWGWLTARIMRFDSLTEHADATEIRALTDANAGRYLVLGLLVGTLNYIPPLFLVTPVLAALAFGHFSLTLLRERRRADEAAQASRDDPAAAPGLPAILKP